MQAPGMFWTERSLTAVDNRLKVSIVTQTPMHNNETRYYPDVCRYIYLNVTRVHFLKNEFGIYSLELFTRDAGEEKQIQNFYLHCTDCQNRGLVRLTKDKIMQDVWQWEKCLYWFFREQSDGTLVAAMQLLPHATYACDRFKDKDSKPASAKSCREAQEQCFFNVGI
jgi:hypothetical protein